MQIHINIYINIYKGMLLKNIKTSYRPQTYIVQIWINTVTDLL